MKLLRNLLLLLLILVMIYAGAGLTALNDVSVPFNLMVYDFEPKSLAVWVLSAFALGGFLGMLVSSVILLRTRASLANCKRQLEKARTEASKVRTESPVAVNS